MKAAYDNLLEEVCVRFGFCGSVLDDQPLHVDQFLPQSGKLTDEDFVDALFKAEGWEPDGAEARKFRSSVREAFVRHMGGTEIDAGQRSRGPSSTFTWNDIVETIEEAPTRLRPGSRAWVVGISAPHQRSGSFLTEHPTGFVYTIEFEDGSSVDAEEAMLRPDSNVR
ncbi:hypothetical protein D3C87_320720 [compost metagenome]|jgi:hypothetical protein